MRSLLIVCKQILVLLDGVALRGRLRPVVRAVYPALDASRLGALLVIMMWGAII